MSKILIEEYKGFNIEFDTDFEKFQCIITEENSKESISFKSIKSFIDEYIKTNNTFKPFVVESIPGSYYRIKNLKIIGMRKDGRFVTEDEKGVKSQVSDYNLKVYMMFYEENIIPLLQLKKLDDDFEIYKSEIVKQQTAIRKTLKIITLEDYKQSLNN